jgi:hypothetical protein
VTRIVHRSLFLALRLALCLAHCVLGITHTAPSTDENITFSLPSLSGAVKGLCCIDASGHSALRWVGLVHMLLCIELIDVVYSV